MDEPRELILCDVRCFPDAQSGSLQPVTLLVGENSTGKTTFLGCYSVLHQICSGTDMDAQLDFNKQPFSMGSFRDIVRSRRGPAGRIEEFKLGLSIAPGAGNDIPSYTLLATFREAGSEPIISSLRYEFGPDSFLELQRQPAGTTVRIPGHSAETNFPFRHVVFMVDSLMALALDEEQAPRELLSLQPIARYIRGLRSRSESRKSRRSATGRLTGVGLPELPELVPVAPLRSRPERSYNPVRESASPEGEHIPMMMMRLSRADRGHWDSLHDDLVTFGRDSGLFSDIKVRGHGGQMSDPFQLQVKVRTGPHANIMDVGYGVSQSLPILVDIMTAPESGRGGRRHQRPRRSFLLQQPEVHLHPRGQAQLADLFIEAFRKHGSRFLIETHSDYIVDRVRIAVRKGALKADDVSVLYFEPAGNAVAIHNMTLDEHGNLRDAPPGYRDFFVKETDRLLGFAD